MLKAVIFDMDGVLVSTDRYHYKAWKALADKNGLNFDFSINNRLRGISRADSLKIILDVNNKTVSDARFLKMTEEKNAHYRRLLDEVTPKDMLPGVLDLIVDLRAGGVKTAIGSSSRNTPKILKQLQIAHLFDAVVDGNTIKKSKPDPEVFLRCAEAVKEASGNCIVVEDAMAGIAAALGAGMVAVGVGPAQLEGANIMLTDLNKVNAKALKSIYQTARTK